MSLPPSDIISPVPESIESTGVPHLDSVLGGGLPKGSLSIIMGPPGSGKTTLASQIAFAAAHRGERALLLTALSESTTKLLGHLQTYDFYSADLVGGAVQIFSLKQFLPRSSQANVAGQEIVSAVRQTRATMVVLDGFQGIRGMESDFASTRLLLYDLGVRLSLLGTTTLITTEADPRDPMLFPEMTTGDVLIGLYYSLAGMRAFRSLEAIKVRGRAPLPGRHSLRLTSKGMEVFPRMETRIKPVMFDGWRVEKDVEPEPARALFDLNEMDALLGGGLPYHTATLVTGSLGTGKTLLAMQFVLAGIAKGEPALFMGMRETGEQLLQKADYFAAGTQLRRALAPNGLLKLHRWEPVELDPDQMATTLLATIEQTGTQRVVIDSMLELERAIRESSGEARVHNFLAAFLAALRERNVTLLAIKEIHKTVATRPDFSADPLAILVDNVVLLQHLAFRSELHRVLSVLKMRFSDHDHAFREFQIVAPDGIRVLTAHESDQDILDELAGISGIWKDPSVPRVGRETTSER